MKNPPSDENPHETRALARFAAVQAVEQARQAGLPLVQAVEQAAQQLWDGRRYAAATIEEWVYKYRRSKFSALQTQPRSDRGRPRTLEPEALEALLKLRAEYPTLTLQALTAELARRGVTGLAGVSASTLRRRLLAAGLDRRSLQAGAALSGGPTKAFELPLPNLLWMTDCMYGPTIKLESGTAQRTFLFAIIDDCSRLIIHGQFYPHERLEGFLDTLRQAVLTRGIPDKLYTDRGAAFISRHLAIVCANLGIRLLHAKPYHAWSKGKIEKLTPISELIFLLRHADNSELDRRTTAASTEAEQLRGCWLGIIAGCPSTAGYQDSALVSGLDLFPQAGHSGSVASYARPRANA